MARVGLQKYLQKISKIYLCYIITVFVLFLCHICALNPFYLGTGGEWRGRDCENICRGSLKSPAWALVVSDVRLGRIMPPQMGHCSTLKLVTVVKDAAWSKGASWYFCTLLKDNQFWAYKILQENGGHTKTKTCCRYLKINPQRTIGVWKKQLVNNRQIGWLLIFLNTFEDN